MPKVKYTAEGQEHFINVGEDVYCDNKIAVRHNGKTYYAGLVEPLNNKRTLALLHFDNSITFDECGNTWKAYNTPTLSSEVTKFGSALSIPNGTKTTDNTTGIHLECNDGITLGGADFTIDFWVWWSSTGNAYASPVTFFDAIGATSYLIRFMHTSPGYVSINSNDNDINFPTLKKNAWSHYALVYQHDRTLSTFYIDGVISGTCSKLLPEHSFARVTLGRSAHNNSQTQFFNGYLDEFRISNVARWTENFTPPTAPYTVD